MLVVNSTLRGEEIRLLKLTINVLHINRWLIQKFRNDGVWRTVYVKIT